MNNEEEGGRISKVSEIKAKKGGGEQKECAIKEGEEVNTII